MAVDVINGVEHVYAPNPKMQGQEWEKEFPPIVTTAKWLINKFTGEIVPNTVEFARRSDILEPYLGELPKEGQGETVEKVNKALAKANGKSGKQAQAPVAQAQTPGDLPEL